MKSGGGEMDEEDTVNHPGDSRSWFHVLLNGFKDIAVLVWKTQPDELQTVLNMLDRPHISSDSVDPKKWV